MPSPTTITRRGHRRNLGAFRGILLFLLLLAAADHAVAQVTWAWRSEAGNGSWSDGNNWWNGSSTGTPAGNELLTFGNNNQTTMTNNLGNTSRWRIRFDSGASSNRTISGSSANTFFDFGGNSPSIQNDSTATHTLNFDIINGNSAGGGFMDINANSGTLVFGGRLSASGGTRNIYQSGSGTAIYNGVITNEGGATLNFIKDGSGTAIFTASNAYGGTTRVTNGVLLIAHDSALGTTASGTSVDQTGASLQMSNNISVTGEALTLNGTGISSGGALRSIHGTNSYLGLITIGSTAYLGAATNSQLTVSNINAGANQFWVVGDGTTIIAGGATNSGDTTAFVKTNTGTAILMASNAWAGNEFIREGTLIISNNNALGAGGITTIGASSGSAAATLELGSGITNSNAITIQGGGTGVRTLGYQAGTGTGAQLGTLTLNTNSLAFNVASGGTLLFGGDVTVNTSVSGANRLALDGGGTLIVTNSGAGISSSDRYQVRIGNGTLIIGAGTIIGRTNVAGLGHALDLGVDLNNTIVDAVSTLRASNNVTISNSIFVSTTNNQARVIGASGENAAVTYSGPIGLANAALTIDSTNGQSVTVSGQITNFTGSTAANNVLIKTGAGTASLTANNTYGGRTFINEGTLAIDTSSRVGTNGITLGTASTAGTLLYSGGNETTSRTWEILAGGGTINVSNAATTLTITNLLTNAAGGTLVKEGAGTLEFARPTAAATGKELGSLDIANGTVLFTGTNFSVSNLAGSGTLIVGAGANTTNLALVGATANTFNGTTIVSGSVLRLSKTAEVVALGGDIQVTGGTVLFGTANNNQLAASSTLTMTAGEFQFGTRTNTIASLTMSGGNLTMGSGSLIVSGASSLTGGTVSVTNVGGRYELTGPVTLGNVLIDYTTAVSGNNNAVVLGDNLSVNPGTTAQFTNTGGGAVRLNLNNAVRTFDVGAGGHLDLDWVVWSSVNSSGGINKTGTGTLTLNQANLFTGGFTLGDGTVRIGTDTSLGGAAGTVTLNGGRVASTDSTGRTLANALAIGGDVAFGQTAGGTGTLEFANTGGVDLGGTTRTFTVDAMTTMLGGLTNGSLVKAGDATLNLSNASINLANLNITGGTVSFLTNATVGGLAGSSGSLNIAAGVLTVNAGTNSNFGLTIGGDGNLTKSGSATLTLSGNNAYTGATTIAGGTLEIDANSRLGNTNATLTISNGGTLRVTAAAAITNAITIGAGDGVLSNASSGAVVYSGAISKDGTTLVSRGGSGTNVFTGVISGASANSDFVVDGGTTVFSNQMTYNGPTIITNGGTLELAVNDAIPEGSDVILGGGTLRTGTASAGYGTSYSLDTLTLTADSTIDLGTTDDVRSIRFADSSLVTWTPGAWLTIMNWQGLAASPGEAGTLLFGVGGLTSDQLAQVRFTGFGDGGMLIGSDGELVPVPEPPVYVAAVLLLAAICWRERRRLLRMLRRSTGRSEGHPAG